MLASGDREIEIEALTARRQLARAAADEGTDARRRAGLYALAGDDRAMALVADARLLACRTSGDVAEHFRGFEGGPHALDFVASAAVLAWSANAEETYDLLREALARANSAQHWGLAAGASERLAFHAELFGDLAVARDAIDEALRVSHQHGLADWHAFGAGIAARLAANAGEADRAASLIKQGRSRARNAGDLAFLAPTAVYLAVEAGDDAAARLWTSPEIVDVARCAPNAAKAIAATTALLAAGLAKDLAASLAVRRALLIAGGANGVELYALCAKWGDLEEEAPIAAKALDTVFGSGRRYLMAHSMLAKAYAASRFPANTGWIDDAAGAALAFNAMGMRRWTNEAMMLLVRQDAGVSPARRSRASGSTLTDRERQIAHLIRRGARNRDVAAALQISEHTVERHVSSILGRLGLRSRWQIADRENDGEH